MFPSQRIAIQGKRKGIHDNVPVFTFLFNLTNTLNLKVWETYFFRKCNMYEVFQAATLILFINGDSAVKNLPAIQETWRHRFDSWVGKIPWRRKLQPTPLPGKSHRQRNLVGYSPWGHKRVRHNRAAEQQAKTIQLNPNLHTIPSRSFLLFSFQTSS